MVLGSVCSAQESSDCRPYAALFAYYEFGFGRGSVVD